MRPRTLSRRPLAYDRRVTALPGTEPHPHARAVLSAALPPAGAPSHAYLFHGPGGTGKRAVARAFAAELLADGAADPAAVRARVERGAHPDLTWVTPSGAHEMLTSDIEEPVVAAASKTPFEARRRVFVIERADTMNDETANRMLKTLEEPAPFAHLVLLTDRPGEVLPTIVSRCQMVRFDPLSEEEVERRLESRGVAPSLARACARLSLGDGEHALALALGDGPALRAAAEGFANAALTGELGGRPWMPLLERGAARSDAVVAELEAALAERLETTARKERKRVETEHAERSRRAGRRARTRALDHALHLVGLWYRDLACVASGAPDVVFNTDRTAELAAAAAGRDAPRHRAALEAVEETRQRLALNVTEDLAFEALAYRLASLLAGGAAIGPSAGSKP
jgi:DNA polymerase-3 subunit delta'